MAIDIDVSAPVNTDIPEPPAAGGGGGHTIQEEGAALTARSNLNFIGEIVTATDNAGTNATDVTLAIPERHITDAMLRTSGPRSVIGRLSGTPGAPADISASADGQVLRRSTTLGFGSDGVVLTAPDLGTPSALVGTNITGTAAGLTAGSVTNGVYTTGSTMTGPLVLAAGTTVLAPIKFQPGTSLSSPVAGVLEFDGTDLFLTV